MSNLGITNDMNPQEFVRVIVIEALDDAIDGQWSQVDELERLGSSTSELRNDIAELLMMRKETADELHELNRELWYFYASECIM